MLGGGVGNVMGVEGWEGRMERCWLMMSVKSRTEELVMGLAVVLLWLRNCLLHGNDILMKSAGQRDVLPTTMRVSVSVEVRDTDAISGTLWWEIGSVIVVISLYLSHTVRSGRGGRM